MVSERTFAQVAPEIDYLPAHFSKEDRESIVELAALAIRHVEQDPETTVTVEMLHHVAQTLIEGACDARTLQIFFISLLDAEETEPLKSRYDSDLLQSAHYVAVIRLLSPKDNPRQFPIRKVLLRQLVLKATHDVRVIMIKIAGRLVILDEAEKWEDENLRQRIAREALEVVVPWCDALGLSDWRQKLQELSFKYLSPEQYNYVLDLMADHRHILHDVNDQVIHEIKALLERHNIQAYVSGRVKAHYSVYRKMQTYELNYHEVWDRIGVRILTNSVFDCYYIQTAIEEELYKERRRYQDYIEKPRKPYNYQSLHLTVAGPKGISVEIQIRTYDMHIKGEYGVAAHWKMYGGGEGADSSEDTHFAFLRTQASQLLGDPMDYLGNTLDALLFNNSILPTDTNGYVLDPDTGERIRDRSGEEIHYRNVVTNTRGYIIDAQTEELILGQSSEPIWFQGEVLPDRVIVYTPDGDLKSLPKGATPLDFAYYIHEDVGHTCVGAKINGKMQKLDYALQLGDRVEIITRKGHRPSLDWLYNGYSRTARAHAKIKHFFREKTDEEVPEVEDLGESIIKKRLSAHKIRDLTLDRLAERLKVKSTRELLEAVGSGEIAVTQLDEFLG
ncbi:MAG TPA: TGS domain-containing protein, partial [Aggregatilineales bacterium]|nr:TGS domain-containing protein [Aggregatilineales bacterium]